MAEYQASDAEIGEELRRFFVDLLADGEKLKRYYDPEQRAELIKRQSFTYDETADLLLNGTLAEIERKILAVTSNPTGAMPLLVVWPPM